MVTAAIKKYLFTSHRLGFRSWIETDVDAMAAINADEKVMEFFPSVQSREQTAAFITRMQKQFAERRHCYFAVEKLEDGKLIGFIGLNQQTFESDFTPCIDIGWRLGKEEWNKGLATEGAVRCLQYGFEELNLKVIYSITPVVNKKSEHIMKKIGMKWERNFMFPGFQNDARLEECVLYKIVNGHSSERLSGI